MFQWKNSDTVTLGTQKNIPRDAIVILNSLIPICSISSRHILDAN